MIKIFFLGYIAGFLSSMFFTVICSNVYQIIHNSDDDVEEIS